MSAAEISAWRERLDALCTRGTVFTRAVVLEQVASTQDAPEARGGAMGTIVTAWRQSAGRGRFGRPWSDTGEDGVAATFVVEAQQAERLAMASAVAAAEAVESALGSRAGIKWPNDVVVRGRKIAGVLIEVGGARALVGIGINVSQRAFEPALVDRATSLALLDAPADRLDILCALTRAFERSLALPLDALASEFGARDALRGTHALFSTPDGPVEGEVLSVDPLRGIVVRDGSSERFLPTQSTSVAEWGGTMQGRLKTGQPGGRYPA